MGNHRVSKKSLEYIFLWRLQKLWSNLANMIFGNNRDPLGSLGAFFENSKIIDWSFLSRCQDGGSSVSSFSFIYPTVSSGAQSIHSHAAKEEVIKHKILEMKTRGDSRINEGERGGSGE